MKNDVGTDVLNVPTGTSNVRIASGNIIIATSGKGIDFSATADAAGMTSELLDDYEEGTWTPAIAAAAGTGTITYTSQNGSYTKIGRQVFVNGAITLSSVASRTGGATITGLPFTINNNNANRGGGTVGRAANLAITSGTSITTSAALNTTTLNLYNWDSSSGTSTLQMSELSDDGVIEFSYSYFA